MRPLDAVQFTTPQIVTNQACCSDPRVMCPKCAAAALARNQHVAGGTLVTNCNLTRPVANVSNDGILFQNGEAVVLNAVGMALYGPQLVSNKDDSGNTLPVSDYDPVLEQAAPELLKQFAPLAPTANAAPQREEDRLLPSYGDAFAH